MFCLFSLLFIGFQVVGALPQSGYAVSRSPSAAEAEAAPEEARNKRQASLMERFTRKWHKLEAKRAQKKVQAGKQQKEVWDDSRFRLGVILLGAALVLGILSILISLGGLISFIAGLFALGGVVLIVWSLVEYYV